MHSLIIQVKSFIYRTPIQQITAVSAAINGGTLYKPFIVKSITEPETNTTIVENTKQKVRDVISKETSQKVAFALESVVTNGTGRNAFIDGYRVGGKTGTAQKVKDGAYMSGNYILSFIGFLPADDPKVIVYVAIDNPKGVVQYGGTVAAPIAKAILEDCITALDIEKSEGASEKNYQFCEKKYVTIPNVINQKLSDVKTKLSSFDVQYTGSGDYIVFQSPSSGERVLEGSKIRILLGDK